MNSTELVQKLKKIISDSEKTIDREEGAIASYLDALNNMGYATEEIAKSNYDKMILELNSLQEELDSLVISIQQEHGEVLK